MRWLKANKGYITLVLIIVVSLIGVIFAQVGLVCGIVSAALGTLSIIFQWLDSRAQGHAITNVQQTAGKAYSSTSAGALEYNLHKPTDADPHHGFPLAQYVEANEANKD